MTLTTPGLSRRRFIGGTGAAGLAASIPLSALADMAGASPPDADKGILLTIFLSGGNDSLNTMGPFDSGVYQDLRLSLAQTPSSSTSAGNGLWFHPSLSYIRQQYLGGNVAVYPAVGEPTNDRSHFSSTATWMTGKDIGSDRSTGWMGRWLDVEADDVLGGSVDGRRAKQIRGVKSKVVAVSRSSSDLLPGSTRNLRGNGSMKRHTHGGLTTWATSSAMCSPTRPSSPGQLSAALRRWRASRRRPLRGRSPTRRTPTHLGLGVRAISASLSGFDTHSNQADRHADRLGSLDRGIPAVLRPAAARAPRADDRARRVGVRSACPAQLVERHRSRQRRPRLRHRREGQGRREDGVPVAHTT